MPADLPAVNKTDDNKIKSQPKVKATPRVWEPLPKPRPGFEITRLPCGGYKETRIPQKEEKSKRPYYDGGYGRKYYY